MKNKSSRGGKEGQGGLTPDDFRLWRDFTRDIEPYEDYDWDALEAMIAQQSPGTKIIKASAEVSKTSVPKETPPINSVTRQEPQLDARTEQKIRGGKMPIEGKLDLHGYKQDEAHNLLNDFVLRAHAQEKRCLLVITGKGKGSSGGAWYDIPEGVLKQKVPQWLTIPPLKEIVLKIIPAHRTHGGEGAVYVYLKRQRQNAF